MRSKIIEIVMIHVRM